ncbi:hypothetical protein EBB56_14220 [Halomonas sp. YLB-10]|nr:hypothetical protein EBB56_14220 [Halomonas sp. YLB-10]
MATFCVPSYQNSSKVPATTRPQPRFAWITLFLHHTGAVGGHASSPPRKPETSQGAVEASGFGLRASGFGLRASGFGLRASGFGLRASGFASNETQPIKEYRAKRNRPEQYDDVTVMSMVQDGFWHRKPEDRNSAGPMQRPRHWLICGSNNHQSSTRTSQDSTVSLPCSSFQAFNVF